jgi:putative transposase
MARKRFTSEQIITLLREAEVLVNQDSTVIQAVRKLGISEQTYYRWRKEYGGMRIDQAKRLKELEQENVRLKKLVADLSLDNAILKEVKRSRAVNHVCEVLVCRSEEPVRCWDNLDRLKGIYVRSLKMRSH